MFKIENENIHLTRGDRADIILNISNYELQLNDKIIFTVKKKFNSPEFLLRKIITVDESAKQSNSVVIALEKEDSTIGELIAKPVKYEYDISLNGDITVIGWDENGAKYFILYPEASDDI